MNAPRWLATAMLASVLCGSFTSSGLAQSTDKKEIIRRAANSYYSLRKAGLVEFRCQITPDWDTLFKSIKSDTATDDEILPYLKQTVFKVAVGPSGAPTISHESAAAPPTAQMAERIRAITASLDQLLGGFFQAWSALAIDPMLPDPEGTYSLENMGDHYQVSYKDGEASVMVEMSMDCVETEVGLTLGQISVKYQPQFERGKNGSFLSGLAASYMAPPKPPQPLNLQMEYRDVEGLSLPSRAVFTMPINGKFFDGRFQFSSYQIKKR